MKKLKFCVELFFIYLLGGLSQAVFAIYYSNTGCFTVLGIRNRAVTLLTVLQACFGTDESPRGFYVTTRLGATYI